MTEGSQDARQVPANVLPKESKINKAELERRLQQAASEYNTQPHIVAGQDSKLFTGKYLDESRTWVRLGSRFGGRVVQACFYHDGGLDVSWHRQPDDHSRILGGRSSGVKKA